MSSPGDGGPAFPGAWTDHLEGIGEVRREQYHGMTLRDYLASQAISKNQQTPVGPINWIRRFIGMDYRSFTGVPSEVARHAYAIADAMLAHRNKPTP